MHCVEIERPEVVDVAAALYSARGDDEGGGETRQCRWRRQENLGEDTAQVELTAPVKPRQLRIAGRCPSSFSARAELKKEPSSPPK